MGSYSFAFAFDSSVSHYNTESDVVHVNLFGNHVVVVNTLKAAQELFEKRSSIYAYRSVC